MVLKSTAGTPCGVLLCDLSHSGRDLIPREQEGRSADIASVYEDLSKWHMAAFDSASLITDSGTRK